MKNAKGYYIRGKKLPPICIFARIGKIPDDYPRYTTPDELITAALGEETQDAFIEKHSRYTGPSDAYSWMEQGTNAAQPHTLRDYINLTLWEEPRFQGIFKVKKMNELYGAFAIKMILGGRGEESKKLEKILSKIQGNTTTQEQALANWILFLKSNFTPGMTVAQFIAQELDKMNSENISP